MAGPFRVIIVASYSLRGVNIMSKKSVYIVQIIVALFGIGNALALPLFYFGDTQQKNVVSKSPFEIALTKGYEALGMRKASEAKSFFDEAIRLDPKSITPWLGLADAAMLANDSAAIEAALKKATELAPDRAEPVIAMARYRYSRKFYDDAEAMLRKAAKMDPQSAVPLVDLGDLYAGTRQNPDKAMEFYREAIRVAPTHAGANYALGSLLLARKDALGAIPFLLAAQESAGDKNPLPSMALGRAYAQAKKWKQAQETFTRALTIEPDLAEAYLGRSATYIEKGSRDTMIADLRKAEELNPRNPEAAFRIGMLQQEAGAAKEAYESYERAIRIEPKLALAYNNLAWLAATRRERLAEALAWIQKARSLVPKEPSFYDTHGWVLRAKGDLPAAVTVLSQGIALRPSADLYYHLGVVQMEMGHFDEARGNLLKALQIQPDFGDAGDAKNRLKQSELLPKAK